MNLANPTALFWIGLAILGASVAPLLLYERLQHRQLEGAS